MKYTPVKEIYIPKDTVETVIAPWVLKILYRRKKDKLKKAASERGWEYADQADGMAFPALDQSHGGIDQSQPKEQPEMAR